MALIKCPECGKQISDKAAACPSCGYPIAAGSSGKINITHKQEGSFEKGFGETVGNEMGGCVAQIIVLGIIGFIIMNIFSGC